MQPKKHAAILQGVSLWVPESPYARVPEAEHISPMLSIQSDSTLSLLGHGFIALGLGNDLTGPSGIRTKEGNGCCLLCIRYLIDLKIEQVK